MDYLQFDESGLKFRIPGLKLGQAPNRPDTDDILVKISRAPLAALQTRVWPTNARHWLHTEIQLMSVTVVELAYCTDPTVFHSFIFARRRTLRIELGLNSADCGSRVHVRRIQKNSLVLPS